MAYRRNIGRKRYGRRKRRRFIRRKRLRRRTASTRGIISKIHKTETVKEQGWRYGVSETRNFGYEVTQNQCHLLAIHQCGAKSDFDGMLDKAVKAGDQNATGLTTLGEYRDTRADALISRPASYSDMLDSSYDPSDRYRAYFKHLTSKMLIRNTDTHPVDVVVYECVAKETRDIQGALSAQNTCVNEVFKGLHRDDIGNSTGTFALNTSTSVIGDDLYDNSTNGVLKSWTNKFSPTKSSVFNKYWKVSKSKKYRLGPGSEINWTMKSGGFHYNPVKLYAEDSANEIIKGVTKVLLIKVCGVLGRSSAAGEESTVGYLSSEVVYQRDCYAKFYPYLQKLGGSVKSFQLSKDNLNAVVLSGITDYVHLDEDGK